MMDMTLLGKLIGGILSELISAGLASLDESAHDSTVKTTRQVTEGFLSEAQKHPAFGGTPPPKSV